VLIAGGLKHKDFYRQEHMFYAMLGRVSNQGNHQTCSRPSSSRTQASLGKLSGSSRANMTSGGSSLRPQLLSLRPLPPCSPLQLCQSLRLLRVLVQTNLFGRVCHSPCPRYIHVHGGLCTMQWLLL